MRKIEQALRHRRQEKPRKDANMTYIMVDILHNRREIKRALPIGSNGNSEQVVWIRLECRITRSLTSLWRPCNGKRHLSQAAESRHGEVMYFRRL